MTPEQWLALILAGGLGGLITALTGAWSARRVARREDRRQAADETSSLAVGAKTITDAAASAVKLQDEQIAEFRQEIRAMQSEVSALNTRMNREIELRMRVQAELQATTARLEREMQAHAATKMQVGELQQTVVNLKSIGERGEELAKINDELKAQLFNVMKGALRLIRQLREQGLEPEYQLDVAVEE